MRIGRRSNKGGDYKHPVKVFLVTEIAAIVATMVI